MVRANRLQPEPLPSGRSRAALWEHGIGPRPRWEPPCTVGGQEDGGAREAHPVWGGEGLAAVREAPGREPGFSQPGPRGRIPGQRVPMAPVGRVVPAAATVGLEAADAVAGRDGGSTRAGRTEVRVVAAGRLWGQRHAGLGLVPTPAPISMSDIGKVTSPLCTSFICKMIPILLNG